MFVGSERIISVRSLPLWAARGLGWALLCMALGDVVPAAWAWLAFPAALIVGMAVTLLGLRDIFAILVIVVIPFVARLTYSAAASPLAFDNGWLLTAPYWYFTAVFTWLAVRHPTAGAVEALALAGWSVSLLSAENAPEWNMSGPAMATLRLTLSGLVLILTILSLAGVYSPIKLRKTGKRSIGSRIIFGLMMTLFLASLLIIGGRVRRERSLESGGGVLKSELFRFDFDDVLNLEPEISLNAELTMLYREDGPSTVRYLRRFTLSGWNHRQGFYRDGEKEVDSPERQPIPVALPKGPESWPPGPTSARVATRQEYYLIALDPDSFFALDYPVSVEPWKIWDDASFTRAYAVESLSSVAGPWELIDADSDDMPDEWMEYYLNGGDDEYYMDLAEEILGEMEGTWNRASAIEKWFREEFRYSLRPGTAPDGDQLSWFLTETRRGYCSYFAFAMTRICRAAGIPARVAVGFLTDPQNSTLGFVPVRSDQAHAWVEVWLDDYGWIGFDPTSDIMAPGEEYPFRFISPDEWLPLVEEVLTKSGEISIAVDDSEDDRESNPGWWNRTWSAAGRKPFLLGLFMLVLIASVYFPGRILPGIHFLLSRFSASYRRRTTAAWRRFSEKLIRAGIKPDVDETPLDWARKAESQGVSGFADWTRLFLKAEYSVSFSARDDADTRSISGEARDAFHKFSRVMRLRSIFSPGWKGRCPW
ncbi:MAG: transglutaminase domain-containing protein [Spirochaetaceae bacterium]|nr:transglutaminase domain-containing protein [Spirochaetaceae bacterium]